MSDWRAEMDKLKSERDQALLEAAKYRMRWEAAKAAVREALRALTLEQAAVFVERWAFVLNPEKPPPPRVVCVYEPSLSDLVKRLEEEEDQ